MTKIDAPIIGANGNIFNLVAIAANAMKGAGVLETTIDEMTQRIFESESYDHALMILLDYINPIQVGDND